MTQDKKHLATIHTTRSVDQYWHVRQKQQDKSEFYFLLERTTPTGTKLYKINKSELPKSIQLV